MAKGTVGFAYTTWLVVWVVVALANPVPEPAAPERPGNRGQPELRPPALSTSDPTPYLKMCVRCHGPQGKNSLHFTAAGRPFPDMSPPRLRTNIRTVLGAMPGFGYYPTIAERTQLEQALAILERP